MAYKLKHQEYLAGHKGNIIQFGRVESNYHPQIVQKLGVKEVPSIVYIYNGKVQHIYHEEYITVTFFHIKKKLKTIKKKINETYFKLVFKPLNHDVRGILNLHNINIIYYGNYHSKNAEI